MLLLLCRDAVLVIVRYRVLHVATLEVVHMESCFVRPFLDLPVTRFLLLSPLNLFVAPSSIKIIGDGEKRARSVSCCCCRCLCVASPIVHANYPPLSHGTHTRQERDASYHPTPHTYNLSLLFLMLMLMPSLLLRLSSSSSSATSPVSGGWRLTA